MEKTRQWKAAPTSELKITLSLHISVHWPQPSNSIIIYLWIYQLPDNISRYQRPPFTSYKGCKIVLYLFCFISGTCAISPLSGIALSTNFTFTCERWSDPDSPLIYEFSYGNNESEVLFYYRKLASGTTISYTDWLSAGEESNNYAHIVTIRIKDLFGSSSKEEFLVQVSELFL